MEYLIKKAPADLAEYVESFWLLHNNAGEDKEVVILPDGRIDLFLSKSETEPFHITLLGIGTQPEQAVIPAGTLTFAISFNLLAGEYILQNPVAHLLNGAHNLPAGFWDFNVSDLDDFQLFCERASHKIRLLLPQETDLRKRNLFQLIYSSKGALTVREISDQVSWSPRQINRYFNEQYGIALKAYCSILRFRASFEHIREGKLFPEQNFADQSHFIREVKKRSGVLPKVLKRNPNDRFVQFSILNRK
jgi:AraC-like DNA-binding protein